MSHEQPYEMNDQWEDLSLPDQEASWQKMKDLLDEEDKRRIPPPLFFRSCAGWGLLLILIACGVWFATRFYSSRNDKQNTTVYKEKHQEHKTADSTYQLIPAGGSSSKQQNAQTDLPETKSQQIIKVNPAIDKDFHQTTASRKKQIVVAVPFYRSKPIKGKEGKEYPFIVKKKNTDPKHKSDGTKKIKQRSSPQGENVSNNPMQEKESSSGKTIQIDTTSKKAEDGTSKNDSSRKAPPVKQPDQKQKDKNKFYFAAGIGEQQQIPLKGQNFNPYNYYGRKGSLADYIPSVYVRLENDKKWFIQSEFRFGAPQSVKQLSYSQVLKSDSGGINTISTSSSVKKTFYHQVPLSFNCYLLPNWSVGTGILYSRFYGAITEQVTRTRNSITQNETISSKLVKIPAKGDSFFTRSQIHILFQTQYQWKRFSIGVRFNQGLQPYIRYKDVNGREREEKNKTLELLVKFQIWHKK